MRPSVGLYFTDTPPAGTPVLIVMGNKAIDIPAGAADYAIEDSYELPIDATVLSVYPHAHYLGKEMTVRAVLPDGVTKTLIHIPRWSFHWQQDYRYVTPIALPRGTRIAMRYTYDNSDANHDNPNHPPRRVKAGPQSSDEMGNLGDPAAAAERRRCRGAREVLRGPRGRDRSGRRADAGAGRAVESGASGGGRAPRSIGCGGSPRRSRRSSGRCSSTRRRRPSTTSSPARSWPPAGRARR